MKFRDLSIKEKAAVIKLGVGGGLRSLLLIELLYDGLEDPPVVLKVNKSKADFVQRLKDPNRAYIQDWNNKNDIATHKLSWAEDDKSAVVYPNVLNVNGELIDFSRPPYNTWAGYDNAVRNGDTVRMTPEEAEWFTTHYKDYYPGFNNYAYGGPEDPPQSYIKQWQQNQQHKFDDMPIYPMVSTSHGTMQGSYTLPEVVVEGYGKDWLTTDDLPEKPKYPASGALSLDMVTHTAELLPTFIAAGGLPLIVETAAKIGTSGIGKQIYRGLNSMAPGSSEWWLLPRWLKIGTAAADIGFTGMSANDFVNDPNVENAAYTVLGASPYITPGLIKGYKYISPKIYNTLRPVKNKFDHTKHDVYNFFTALERLRKARINEYDNSMISFNKGRAYETLANNTYLQLNDIPVKRKKGIVQFEKINEENKNKLGQSIVNRGKADSYSINSNGDLTLNIKNKDVLDINLGNSGDYTVTDFYTGKTYSGTVTLPSVSGGDASYTFINPDLTNNIDRHGINIAMPDISNVTVNGLPNTTGNISDVVNNNIKYVQEHIPGFKPFGSAVGVSEKGIHHVTGDIDGFMTKEDLLKYSKQNPVIVRPRGDDAKHVTYDQLTREWETQTKIPDSDTYLTIVGEGKFGKDGLIDLNVIDISKNGTANNNRTFEVYRQFFPEEYQKLVALFAGRETKEIKMLDKDGKILTNQLLLDAFDPIDKTIMDSMEIDWDLPGKEKHKTRLFGYLLGDNPLAVHRSLDRTSKMQFGKNGKLLPEMTFDNFENRGEEVVQCLKDVGYEDYIAQMIFEKAVLSKNIQYLQNAFDYAYISNFKFYRATNAGTNVNNINPSSKQLMINATTWNPSAGGGTGFGSGLNTTQGNLSGHNREINALLQPLLNIDNNKDFVVAIKEMIRQNKPLGKIDDVLKLQLHDQLGINADTYEDLFSKIPNNDKNLFDKVIKIVKTNILTSGRDYNYHAMYSGMRDLDPDVDAVGIHGGDIFDDIRKRFGGIPSLRDRKIMQDNAYELKSLFEQNNENHWYFYSSPNSPKTFVTDVIPDFRRDEYNSIFKERYLKAKKYDELSDNHKNRENRIINMLGKTRKTYDNIQSVINKIMVGSAISTLPLYMGNWYLQNYLDDKNFDKLKNEAENHMKDSETVYQAISRIKESDYYGLTELQFKTKYRESKSKYYENKLELEQYLLEYTLLYKERTEKEYELIDVDLENLTKDQFENKYLFDKSSYKRMRRSQKRYGK